jgi:DNA-binding MarR family transcriptional regulator
MSKTITRSNLRPSPLALLHRACQRIDDLFQGGAGDDGVTPRQYAVLRILADQTDVSQTDISDATGIDRSTLADIVRRLVGKGLVQRKRTKHDARMYAVRLTDAGRTALTAAGLAARNADSGLLSALNVAEREQFLDLLQRAVEGKGQVSSAKKTFAVVSKMATKAGRARAA